MCVNVDTIGNMLLRKKGIGSEGSSHENAQIKPQKNRA